MRAEIISIGTEILLGEITDTNAAYLAGQLPGLGIDLYWISQVGDNQPRIVEILQRAWDRSDLILITGGLGPTEDDLTRESIAQLLDEEMSIDPALEKTLREFFIRLGFPMPDRNLKQATLIPSSKALPNPRGTAPGWWVEREGKFIIAMPGPPKEMRQMWEVEVKPELQKICRSALIYSRTLKTFGIGEANVDEKISPLLAAQNPSIGVYARPAGVEVRLTAKAATEQQATEMIAPLEEQVRSVLGDHIWGVDDDTLQSVVGNLLRQKGLTLATMESCTGGQLADLITDVAGSSDYFKGGLVSYSNEMKGLFGVNTELIRQHGAVSPEVAGDMARAVRDKLGSDIGIGITGVAGPSTLEGKPPGTVHIAITDGITNRHRLMTFPRERLRVKRFAALMALYELRCLLLGKNP